MRVDVRPMRLAETSLIVEYFHGATPEHLEMLGVDPTRLPPAEAWRERYQREFGLSVDQRSTFMVVWLEGERPIGFSTTDKIVFGESAHMHLHVVEAGRRNQGIGTECVRRSVEIYFETLKLKRLFCEPNAFNVAPNRTLQKAGFRYVKTHKTVPGPLNYHQAVNRWVVER
jgi:RimJ/RimL family protein N-acetyltransferase